MCARSSTVSPSSSGSVAVASDLPYTNPFLTPPPASTTENTFGQWSRPAVPLIFGVRPNSLEIITSVLSSIPFALRSLMSAA